MTDVDHSHAGPASARREERARLAETVERELRETLGLRASDPALRRVVDAVARVPREVFVPRGEAHLAYADHALPIGSGQTISQPFVVALMTYLLRIEPGHRVLEVGSGSGYQAAVLAELAGEVYTLEIIPELARGAREHLDALGYRNVQVAQGDGRAGWPEHAPFDGIIVTAAAPDIPPALVEQLGRGGRLVMPLGETWDTQWVVEVEKDAGGQTSERRILPVRFVPLTGG